MGTPMLPVPFGDVVALTPTALPPDRVTVAGSLVLPGGHRLRCPAAPLLFGAVGQLGVPVGVLDVVTRNARPGDPTVMYVATTTGARGEAYGLAAGAARGTPADLVARRAVDMATLTRRSRKLLMASPRSFCAGVERAIEVVERTLDQRDNEVYVRKQIVHNAHVVRDLEFRGAVFVEELDQVPDGATVVFSAHGVSPAVRDEARRRGLDVIDATCPLVTKVHAEARRFAARGDTVVLIGHADHEEVEGTLGEAPQSTVIVESAEDVRGLAVPDPQKVSYLTQTTLATDETVAVVEALRERYPAVSGPPSDDICYATTNRQHALAALTSDADLVLVVGSVNSSNSVRLVELARRHGTAAHLIDDATDVDLAWLLGAGTVGLTAGASAPASLVDGVVAALGGLGPVEIAERTVTSEDMHFALPRKVRNP